MSTYFMFGTYSSDSLEEISAERTQTAVDHIEQYGGKVKSMYALLGDYDLVFIVDFPGVNAAMKASLTLTRLTGISFSTSEAVSVEEFDKMLSEL